MEIARNNLIDTIEKIGYQVLTERLNTLEQQIKKYESIIADYKEKKSDIEVSRKVVEEAIGQLKNFLKDPQYTEKESH